MKDLLANVNPRTPEDLPATTRVIVTLAYIDLASTRERRSKSIGTGSDIAAVLGEMAV